MAAKKSEVVTTEDIAPVDDTKADGVKYAKVISPAGVESTVPDSILQVLLDSGYKKSK